ncbi:hypothetical protein GGH99_002225 [Coemansia sp. RSA 1285]|nr:hypothetical protein GGH99_002225 [Coemansia sp. RSA 1285]
MAPNDTIRTLRNNIATKSQVEPQKQRLIYCGRLLSNDTQTLVEVGMNDECALHMVAGRASNADNTGARTPHQQNQHSQPRIRASRVVYSNFGSPFSRDVMPQRPHQTELSEEDIADDAPEFFSNTTSSRNPPSPGYPLNENTPAEVFQPISGFSAIPRSANIQLPTTRVYTAQNRLQGMAESERVPPTVAQANELIYDLFTHVLPSIRRHPGREGFHFSTTESTSPTFISPTSNSQVSDVGGTLVNLGDAFAELGRSLQEVGHEWQTSDSFASAETDAATSSIYSTAHMQAILLTLTQLVRVSPLVIPFLQSTITHTPLSGQQPQPNNTATDSTLTGDSPVRRDTSDTLSQNIPNHGYRDAMNRRFRRHRSLVDFMVDANRIHDPSNADANPFGGVFGNIGISLMPSIFIEPTFAEHRQRPTGDSSTNPNTGTTAPNDSGLANLDGNTNASRNSGPRTTDTETHSTRSSNTARVVHRTMRSIGGNHMIEAIIQQIGVPIQQSSSNTGNARTRSSSNTEPSQQSRQQQAQSQPLQQQQQQQRHLHRQQAEQNSQPEVHAGSTNATLPLEATAGGMPDVDATTPVNADGSNGLFSFIERLRSFGSRNTAQSDRSNASTSTEYSTSNGIPPIRNQRSFTINSGIMGSSPTIQPAQVMNPFSFASIFLGAEPGSTRNTSRRTSLSSTMGGGNDTSANLAEQRTASSNTNASEVISNGSIEVNAQSADGGNGMHNVSALASSSDSIEPRTGDTRARGASSYLPDSATSSNSGEESSNARRCAGSNKRHKTSGGADEDDNNGSSS